MDAPTALATDGLPDVSVTYVGDWHVHPKFVEANACHVRDALDRLPVTTRAGARLVFTAHSVPVTMTGAWRYRRQIQESARLVAAAIGTDDWTVVFQSRSGRPEDPWLSPDVCEYLRAISSTVSSVVLVPDLDCEAAAVCREIGLPIVPVSLP